MKEKPLVRIIFSIFLVFMVVCFIELFKFHLILINTKDMAGALKVLNDQDVWIVHVFRLFMSSNLSFGSILKGILSTINLSTVMLVVIVGVSVYKTEYFKKFSYILILWILVNLSLLIVTGFVFQLQLINTGFNYVHIVAWVCLILDVIAILMSVSSVIIEVAQ